MAFIDSTGVRVNDYFSRLEVDDEDGSEFTDRWNTGELLCLASAVQRSGDKNWVSVSRAIKPFGEPKRPSDWYTPKNCALQYSKLLKGVEDFKKKSLPRTERETSEELLVKNLTDKRITELNWLNQQAKSVANSLKVHMELIESGEYDDALDELLKQIEEQEKKEEEDFKEWISRRENLNAAKRLNKCRVPLSKGKAPLRGLDNKRKNSPNPDQVEDSSVHSTVPDIVIKQEIDTDHEFIPSSKPVHIKTETDAPSSIAALLEGSKASTVVPTTPSSIAPTSPLLTSLLRNVPSSNTGASTVSYASSPLKEQPDASATDTKSVELDMVALITKSQEASPRASLPQSPRPTPASSPLLNSLLKNSPSATSPLTPMQLSQNKEATTPKAVSSPQSFFNPTSALATAAAQQLAVATSALPQSHVFFSSPDSSDRSKLPPPSSLTSSACLSAPTLSKLLEMPPSTPGRLPPLPVVDTVTNTVSTPTVITPEQVVAQSPIKSTTVKLLSDLELQISSSPPKKSENVLSAQHSSPSDQVVQNKNSAPTTPVEKKPVPILSNTVSKSPPVDQKVPFKRPGEMEDTSQENIDILEAVCESINQAFEKKEIKQEPIDPDYEQSLDTSKTEVAAECSSIKHVIKTEKTIPDDILSSAVNIEKLVSSADINLDVKVFSTEDITDTSELNLFEDDKQKVSDMDIDNSPVAPTFENITDAEEEDNRDNSPSKSSETRSPPAKKPRLLTAKEKKELSEDEIPIAKRPGRKAKKGRKPTRSTPVKQAEPKDQYEFSESTEENSVGYQAANTLCYMPRVKDEVRVEESKAKQLQSQSSEDTNPPPNAAPSTEKKHTSPVKNKPGRPPSQSVARKALFTSDEERMSDSMTSDDASNSHFGDDKLKKWKEFAEKKEDSLKEEEEGGSKSLQKSTKTVETPKKKLQQIKRNLFPSCDTPKKEKKSVSSDIEESSACSRDSEDAAISTAWQKDDVETNERKDSITNVADDVEVEANDSRMSSSVTAESDKQIDEVEGYESLQGSVTTEFSPLPQSEVKEEKDLSQFGNKDWFQGTSPKSSEPVSQSSEESEYESDNWDSQSASTNKSATHSSGQTSRTKRKERESPQYKAWKKAISIVLREASCHKYANVFLQKVTNDVAPGYLSIVYRPMDLSLLKKNVDNGVVKTTAEVHRDMLLMFQNAVMYNSSDHDVHHMAVEMQRDVIQQIQAFLKTQFNDKDESSEPTSSLRGARKSQKTYASSTKPKEEGNEKE